MIELVAIGKTFADIGTVLGISPRTVKHHVDHIKTKLGTCDKTSAAVLWTKKKMGGDGAP